MKRSTVNSALLAGVLLLGFALPVVAQRAPAYEVPLTGTLKKIRDTGVVRIGFRENSPPFAFRASDGKPVGYALDICEIVVDEIATALRREVRVEMRPVTPENRFDLVIKGDVDLECGSSTNNAE